MRIAYLHYLCARDTALNHVRQFADAARRLDADITVHPMNLAAGEAGGDGRATRASALRQMLQARFGRVLHEPKELLWNARYVRKELRLLAPRRPDVLLVRDHLFNASCVPVARRLRLPLVLEMNAPAEESRLYLDQYVHLPHIPEWLEGWKLRAADAVTVVSSSLKDHLVRKYDLAPERVAVVPNGADLDRFRPDMPVDASLPPDWQRDKTVGFVGSFQKWHGTALLAEMVCALHAARPDVRVLLVGDGPEAARLRRSLPTERVTFLGSVPHERVPGLVASFAVGVLPEADFYRCPLKLIEWMAAGKAIVAPRYAPIRDLISDGVEGLLFAPGDGQAMVRSILQLLADPALTRRLGAAAARRAHASLSWADNARRVLAACSAARACRDPHAARAA